MIAKDAVSTAALPTPLTTRSARQTQRNAVDVFRKITRLKAPAETAQMTCPASSSDFLWTSLHNKLLLSGVLELYRNSKTSTKGGASQTYDRHFICVKILGSKGGSMHAGMRMSRDRSIKGWADEWR